MKQQAINGGMTCDMAQRAIALTAMSWVEKEFHEGSSFPESGLAQERSAQNAPNGTFAGIPPAAAKFPGPSTKLSTEPSPPPESPIPTKLSVLDISVKGRPGTEEALTSGSFDRASSPETTVASSASDRSPNSAFQVPEQGALAQHLRTCRSCQAEMAATTAFFCELANESSPEPSATLLAQARVQLDATLDSCELTGPLAHFMQQLAFTAGRLRAAPALSSALLLAGLLTGGYGGYHAGHAAHAAEQTTLLLAPPAPEAPSVVADVSSISRDPGTGLVEVRYDRLVPDVLTAPADDPSIRELLMAATQNGIDPQVRNVSVNLLATSCHAGAPCLEASGETPVRHALLNALQTDKTPEVRREALAGLQPFIAEDTEVRDAVLTALMSDSSASVRIEAVRLLQPVDVDSSVRQALHTVASHDGDPLIRSASLAALKSVPQVQ